MYPVAGWGGSPNLFHGNSYVFLRKEVPAKALPVALGSGLTLFVVTVSTANLALLSERASSPISLSVDLALLVGSLALAAWLFSRRLTVDPDRRFAVPWILVGIGTVVAAATPIFLSNETRREETTRVEARTDLPNILFILADTLRADHLGAYGYAHPTSPWIDDLAARGVVFENAISTASHTKPSTASIFTSRYPPAHRARLLRDALPEGSVTFTQSLQTAGYRTAAFSANTFVSRSFGFGPGFDHFEDRTVYFNSLHISMILLKVRGRVRALLPKLQFPIVSLIRGLRNWQSLLFGEISVRFRAEDLSVGALDWIDENHEAPFFIYLHVLEPHTPYSPSEEQRRNFEKIHASQTERNDFPSYIRGFLPFRPGPELEKEERDGLLALYDAEIADMDAALGRLEQAAQSHSQDRPLLIVFTSDHGEEFFDHNGWGHMNSLFTEVLQVPLILAGLPNLPAGKRIDRQVSLVDLAPTLLDLLDLPAVEAFQGTSIRGLLEATSEGSAKGTIQPSPIFSEISKGGDSWARSLSSDGYKLILTESEGKRAVHLFDLADRDERHNLTEENPSDLRRLDQELQAVLEASRRLAPAEKQQIELNNEQVEQLRQLGYVD